MPLSMPPDFPEEPFLNFGRVAGGLFPSPVSQEAFDDPLHRVLQFTQAWRAVRNRYRLCTECNDEFKVLLAHASELSREWALDEEQNYKIERCVYLFFMGGLSVFESLGFCLYFLGYTLKPREFPQVNQPKQITLAATRKAFTTAFPNEAITRQIADLSRNADFIAIDAIRNILAHRLAGKRTIRTWGTTHPDGTETLTREESWHLPGLNDDLVFDEGLIQRYLEEITRLLTMLVSAALEFVENHRPGGTPP